MGSKFYIPAAFRSFQGFVVRDIKEFRENILAPQASEIILGGMSLGALS